MRSTCRQFLLRMRYHQRTPGLLWTLILIPMRNRYKNSTPNPDLGIRNPPRMLNPYRLLQGPILQDLCMPQSLKTRPQPELKSSTRTSRSSSPCLSDIPTTQTHRNSSSTLTIGDLYKRFHNSPSPLNLVRFDTQHIDSPQYQLSLAATNSLSKFLLSALPAFTRFLSDIQGGQYDNYIIIKERTTIHKLDLHQENGQKGTATIIKEQNWLRRKQKKIGTFTS
jgi:hypothetical protein